MRAGLADLLAGRNTTSAALVRMARPRVKNELDINIELVSPPDFVLELPGWRERSPFVFDEGQVTVRHFDPYSQALAN